MMVLVIGIAALAIVGLRTVGERWLSQAHLERTTAGASLAAVTELVDLYIEWQSTPDDRGRPRRPLPEVMTDAIAISRARTFADRIASANGLGPVTSVKVTCAAGQVDVFVAIGRQEAQAGFPAPECSRH
jgi:hypothetical protein